jgi:hypothetical protein
MDETHLTSSHMLAAIGRFVKERERWLSRMSHLVEAIRGR